MHYAAGDRQRDIVEQQMRDELMQRLQRTLQPERLVSFMREGEALCEEEGAQLGMTCTLP